MNIWNAGTASVATEKGFAIISEVGKKFLWSYYYRRSKGWTHIMDCPFCKVFLDSGAFSAWTAKETIDLDKYIEFCLKHQAGLDVIASLDVIPGEFGRPGTEEEKRASASQGWKNYNRMLRAGVDPNKLLHIFHQDEDFRWLERLVKKDEATYIGLSPANDRNPSQRAVWLQECMKYVLDTDGMPLVKFHGFGVTSLRIMRRFPWYSVDSSTPFTFSRFGVICVPRKKNGRYDYYHQEPIHVFVSNRSPRQREKKAEHLHAMKAHFPRTFDHVREYLDHIQVPLGSSEVHEEDSTYRLKDSEKWLVPKGRRLEAWKVSPRKKFEVETIHENGVSTDYRLRDKVNLMFFKGFEESCPEWPWAMPSRKIHRGLLL